MLKRYTLFFCAYALTFLIYPSVTSRNIARKVEDKSSKNSYVAPEMAKLIRPKLEAGIDYNYHHQTHNSRFAWISYKPKVVTEPMKRKPLGHGKHVTSLNLKQPVYVSMTTTLANIKKVHIPIIDILNGTLIPTHVFLFISEAAYLRDGGISRGNLTNELHRLASRQPFTIVFTNNIGPHRKLLPLLAKFWSTDCVIITMDDDRSQEFTRTAVEKLLAQYIASGKNSIVALRARRIGMQVTNAFVEFRHRILLFA